MITIETNYSYNCEILMEKTEDCIYTIQDVVYAPNEEKALEKITKWANANHWNYISISVKRR